MRLTTLLIIISTLAVSAKSYSQDISLSVEKVPVKKVLNQIGQQTGYSFLWSKHALRDLPPVSVSLKKTNLEDALKNTLKGLPLTYKIKGKVVYIEQKSASPERTNPLTEPSHTITGIVTDSATGNPLVGVTVKVKGSTTGTTTDKEGRFVLENISDNAVLEVSYLGYKPRTLSTEGRTAFNISLATMATGLDQLVVVGYGTQQKKTLTGAISVIEGADLVRTKNENVVNMLTGKLPGVRVVQKSAAPGDYDAVIDIRGMGAPLFVIDGIVRDQAYFSRMSAEEIDNISVLKDASAAIYGLRAANGVILVTTKSGRAQNGKVDIIFSSSYSIQQFLSVPESVGAVDYMTLRNEKKMQDFGKNYFVQLDPDFTEADFQPYLDGEKQSYNWMDAVFRKSTPQQEHNLSVNGGNEKLRYYFNLGYSKQMGSYKSNDYKSERWNLRSNVDAQITPRLKARVSLGAILTDTKKPNGVDWTAYKLTWLSRPDAAFYANDNPEYPNGDSKYLNGGNNMIVQTDADYVGYNLNKDRRFNGTLRLEYDIPGISGLSAKGLYDYSMSLPDYNNYKRAYTLYRYNPDDDTYSSIERNTPSDITKGVNFNFDTDMQLGLYYRHSFGKHNLNSFLIYEETYNSWDGFSAYRELMVESEYLFAGADKNQRAIGGGVGDRASKSLIGSFTYNYDKKYLLDFKFRYDGSSRFPEGSRFGFFPAILVGWRLSEENFIKDNIPFLSNLKLRASYGEMGDDASAGNYPPATGYNLDGNNLGWYYDGTLIGGVSAASIPNPDLTWYRIKSYNAGLDFGILNQMLSGSFDLYKRDRSGLLATSAAVIPGTVGASLPQENLNSDRNFGYEISLMHRNNIGDISYYVRGQISGTKYMRTKWLETPASNSYDKWRNRTSGRYGNIWWGNESEGMFTSLEQIRSFDEYVLGQGTLPGDWYLNDWNEDGVINGNDDHPIATYGLPVFTYGFSIGATWKGFDLAMDFQGTHGVYAQYAEVLTEALPFGGQNTLSYFMDRWHPADPNADYFSPDTKWIPGYYPVTGRDGRRTGTNAVQNASYMRLKTAELGYTLPESLLSKVGIKNLRFYLSGYNLLTFTQLKNVDPERPGSAGGASTSNLDMYNYPVNKTYTIGVRIKF